ncbi:HNH endonuclease signature motif containing protein, partial [Acrocarpospora pleiomorpha]
LSDEQAALVEPILVELADGASPAEIGKAGRYLRELLDPGTLEDEAEDDYATRFLLVRPSSTGGVEGEFRLPREAGARLREFLTAYARPRGKDEDRPLRVRQADALSALLSKKVTTELLVLVRAESLPTDHPTHDHPTHDHPTTGHPTPDADPTHAASAAASGTPATPAAGAPPSQSASGRAGTAESDRAAADTAGSSDAQPGTPQAAHGSTRRAGGPSHTGGTGSAGAATRSAGTGSAGAGTGSAGSGAAEVGAGSAGSGAGPVPEACRTCGHAPDRLAPGLLIATGQLLPISDVHRLARTSKLVRMVIDAKGRVLDMGRAVRLATPAQRQAILARYTTCYRDDCTIPADMCEIDHVQGWADGGTTDLNQLAPACTWHNRDKATHPDRYRTHRNHDGTWTLLYLSKRGRFAGRFRR